MLVTAVSGGFIGFHLDKLPRFHDKGASLLFVPVGCKQFQKKEVTIVCVVGTDCFLPSTHLTKSYYIGLFGLLFGLLFDCSMLVFLRVLAVFLRAKSITTRNGFSD